MIRRHHNNERVSLVAAGKNSFWSTCSSSCCISPPYLSSAAILRSWDKVGEREGMRRKLNIQVGNRLIFLLLRSRLCIREQARNREASALSPSSCVIRQRSFPLSQYLKSSRRRRLFFSSSQSDVIFFSNFFPLLPLAVSGCPLQVPFGHIRKSRRERTTLRNITFSSLNSQRLKIPQSAAFGLTLNWRRLWM